MVEPVFGFADPVQREQDFLERNPIFPHSFRSVEVEYPKNRVARQDVLLVVANFSKPDFSSSEPTVLTAQVELCLVRKTDAGDPA